MPRRKNEDKDYINDEMKNIKKNIKELKKKLSELKKNKREDLKNINNKYHEIFLKFNNLIQLNIDKYDEIQFNLYAEDVKKNKKITLHKPNRKWL
jgi:predicted translin family RNA/ssDNA-binding protein